MLLKNEKYESEFFEKGYVQLKLFSASEVDALYKDSLKLINQIPRVYLKGFISVGRIPDASIRLKSTEIIKDHVIDRLQDLFYDNYEIVSGVHLIKMPGFKGKLNIHQDSSMIDERQYTSVYAWMPLRITNFLNGTLNVIPGSHKLGNIYRTLNIPNPFADYIAQLKKYEIPLYLKKGEVVIFHSALMHSSPINLSLHKRLAINCFIKPKTADLIHYYRDEQTPANKIEQYKTDPSFYYGEDILKRPDKKRYPFLGYTDWEMPALSQTQFNELCNQYLQS